jgi:c-di-GMP-binding flagellar brake protein YcgR
MVMTDNERRQFFRIEVDTPIRFRLIEENTSKPLTDWMKGITADVGLGGVKVIASMSQSKVETLVDKYVVIELSFQLPGTAKTIAAKASIAYFMRGDTTSKATMVSFGAQFVTIDNSAEDIIGEFISQRTDSPAKPEKPEKGY